MILENAYRSCSKTKLSVRKKKKKPRYLRGMFDYNVIVLQRD